MLPSTQSVYQVHSFFALIGSSSSEECGFSNFHFRIKEAARYPNVGTEYWNQVITERMAFDSILTNGQGYVSDIQNLPQLFQIATYFIFLLFRIFINGVYVLQLTSILEIVMFAPMLLSVPGDKASSDSCS